ncbi:hypothetical protein A4X09_0g7013 [Tilletia walkeri]|uniref:Uncharacterized protein n=1 Tax=Tilletia walkeri TaxID=117179 RepID=A0A8X7N2Q9_9BASI|nr:hypothetical protein A4X09_0g7013 [Tilletia walkeri]
MIHLHLNLASGTHITLSEGDTPSADTPAESLRVLSQSSGTSSESVHLHLGTNREAHVTVEGPTDNDLPAATSEEGEPVEGEEKEDAEDRNSTDTKKEEEEGGLSAEELEKIFSGLDIALKHAGQYVRAEDSKFKCTVEEDGTVCDKAFIGRSAVTIHVMKKHRSLLETLVGQEY